MKSLIRLENLAKRNELTKAQVEQKSNLISKRLQELAEYKQAKTVMFYYGIKNEVQTRKMIQKALEEGKKALLPKTEFKKKEMEPVEIKSLEDLKETKQGLYEPEGKQTQEKKLEKTKQGLYEPEGKQTQEKKLDMIIFPGVAFDAQGGRLGQGMGFYDSFIRKTKGKIVLVGLAFEENMEEKVPTESHDIRMDIVITDKRTVRCKK